MTESFNSQEEAKNEDVESQEMLVRRSIIRLKNRIQALLYEDSGRE
jgi:hypothetical protein